MKVAPILARFLPCSYLTYITLKKVVLTLTDWIYRCPPPSPRHNDGDVYFGDPRRRSSLRSSNGIDKIVVPL